MDRKDLHKAGKSKQTVADLRDKWKKDKVALSKEKRSQLLDAKRIRHSPAASPAHSSEAGGEEEEISIHQVDKAVHDLAVSDQKLSAMKLLQRAFSQGLLLIEHFIKQDGALDRLVGILSGNDSSLLLDAVWCFTNLATGDHETCLKIAKAASAYIVTYLSQDSHPLAEQCAWTLGNIAGDSAECRALLMDQGAVPPLMKLLKSEDRGCVQNAAFALSNLARGDAQTRKSLLNDGLMDMLLPLLRDDAATEEIVTEVSWVLAYVSASSEFESQMMECGAVDLMLKQLKMHASDEDLNNNVLITPVLRFLGNIFSGPDDLTEKACINHTDLIYTLSKFLTSNHRNVVKEVLWVFSNMAGVQLAARQIVDAGLITKLVSLLSSSYEIKIEAAYVLCHIAAHCDKKWCTDMKAAGAVPAFVPMLRSHNGEEIHVALSYLAAMFETLHCTKEFEEAGGLAIIEPLEYHSDEGIKAETNMILEKHFYKENGEEAIMT